MRRLIKPKTGVRASITRDISDNQDTSHFTPIGKAVLIVIIWIPLLSVMAYVMIGDRTPVYQLWDAQNRLGKVADDLLTAKSIRHLNGRPKTAWDSLVPCKTNVHHHATDPLRWFRLSEVFVACNPSKRLKPWQGRIVSILMMKNRHHLRANELLPKAG